MRSTNVVRLVECIPLMYVACATIFHHSFSHSITSCTLHTNQNMPTWLSCWTGARVQLTIATLCDPISKTDLLLTTKWSMSIGPRAGCLRSAHWSHSVRSVILFALSWPPRMGAVECVFGCMHMCVCVCYI